MHLRDSLVSESVESWRVFVYKHNLLYILKWYFYDKCINYVLFYIKVLNKDMQVRLRPASLQGHYGIITQHNCNFDDWHLIKITKSLKHFKVPLLLLKYFSTWSEHYVLKLCSEWCKRMHVRRLCFKNCFIWAALVKQITTFNGHILKTHHSFVQKHVLWLLNT